MHLGTLATRSGRDNNFNLIRLLAAAAVLVNHSFSLSTGITDDEPLARLFGISLGRLAVVVFFITSGFLVGGSLESRRDPIRFLASRALRIYPALVVVVVLTTFVAGPILSSWTPSSYFSSWDTYRYLLADATAIFGVEYRLPGVFEHTPLRLVVNGSLWTLTFELWMYALLLLAWLATAWRGPRGAFPAVVVGLVAAGTACCWQRAAVVPTSALGLLGWLGSMFFLGVAAHLFRARLPMHWTIALAAVVLLIGSMADDLSTFKAAYPLCLAYLVLFMAYETPAIAWMRRADYSYGLYLYAFVVQQILASAVPGISALTMTLLALPIALSCAVASWHLVEKPSLARLEALASRFAGAARRSWAGLAASR